VIALLGGIYDGKYAAVDELPAGSVLHVTAGRKSETYRVLAGNVAEVVDEGADKITVAIKPQYVCPQHTFPAGLVDGTRTPPRAIR
jgi:hypothetical protein